MIHYAMQLQIRIMQLKKSYCPAECWKPDCKEEALLIFDFMDMPFPACEDHCDEFFDILKLTFGIFLMAKRRGDPDAKEAKVKPEIVVEPEDDPK